MMTAATRWLLIQRLNTNRRDDVALIVPINPGVSYAGIEATGDVRVPINCGQWVSTAPI